MSVLRTLSVGLSPNRAKTEMLVSKEGFTYHTKINNAFKDNVTI